MRNWWKFIIARNKWLREIDLMISRSLKTRMKIMTNRKLIHYCFSHLRIYFCSEFTECWAQTEICLNIENATCFSFKIKDESFCFALFGATNNGNIIKCYDRNYVHRLCCFMCFSCFAFSILTWLLVFVEKRKSERDGKYGEGSKEKNFCAAFFTIKFLLNVKKNEFLLLLWKHTRNFSLLCQENKGKFSLRI